MSGDEKPYLEGDDLAPFKIPNSGRCWWCGAKADSREHKFKRTDLSRMWDKDDHLIWVGDRREVKVRSARKSPVVKFAANLCARCNNMRSQPFDTAYDLFSTYVWEHPESLYRSSSLNMKLIYGKDWSVGALDLGRYVAKHIGCRMAASGYAVPDAIIPFLEGVLPLSNIQMTLFKDPERWKIYRDLKKDGIQGLGLWLPPAWGEVSRSRGQVVVYSSALIVGYIGVMYRWSADTAETDLFYLHRRVSLPWYDQSD